MCANVDVVWSACVHVCSSVGVSTVVSVCMWVWHGGLHVCVCVNVGVLIWV